MPKLDKSAASELEVYEVWPSATGITDLSQNWKGLSVPSIADIIPIWSDEKRKLENSSQLRTFTERLAREWAIETGVIEDVFHIDRGTTITLIEQGLSSELIERGSTNKPAEYIINILRDHVEALDWLFESFVVTKEPMTTGGIKNLHGLLTGHQSHVDAYALNPNTGSLVPTEVALVRGKWKIQANNVVRDGIQFDYCPPLHTDEEMVKLVEWHNRHQLEGVSPEVEAAWLHHRFTQIHPFHDGNGRVARALASLVFIQAGLFPLVIERGKIREQYITALEKADAGDLRPLVQVFAKAQQSRFDRALSISDDLAEPPKSVELAVEALKARYSSRKDEVASRQKTVFDLSKVLETAAVDQMERIRRLLNPIVSSVSRSTPETSHYYRHQIGESARSMDYFANTTVYRSWVRLAIEGESAAHLLLSFHGRGSEFAGVMVCLPVFELIFASDETNAPNDRTQIQITDRPFDFYFTESEAEVLPRFHVWLDETVTLALSQLQRNL